MTTSEITKGIAGSATGLMAMATGWISELEPVLRVCSLTAGLILTLVMIRYWWAKGTRLGKVRIKVRGRKP